MSKFLQNATTLMEATTTKTEFPFSIDLEGQTALPSTPSAGQARITYNKNNDTLNYQTSSGNFILTQEHVICHAVKIILQSIFDNTDTLLTWDDDYRDTSGLHQSANWSTAPSAVTTRFTIQTTGIYKIACSIDISTWTTSASRLRLRLLKNGTAVDTLYDQDVSVVSGGLTVFVESYLSLSASDYLQIEMLQVTGGSVDVTVESFCVVESATKTVNTHLKRPKGHDVSKLDNVISHWRCLASDLGTTTLTDVLGNHHGTLASSWVSGGKPWVNEEGQHWLTQKVTLANTTNLLTELRDASCAVMLWCYVPKILTASNSPFNFGGNGESSATNVMFQFRIAPATGGFSPNLVLLWERTASGTDVATTFTQLAPGLHHICVAREHETGAGTSTAHAWVDGVRVSSVAGKSSPIAGEGTSATGYLLADAAGSGTNFTTSITDIVLISGSIPTDAQVLEQYNRGIGVY